MDRKAEPDEGIESTRVGWRATTEDPVLWKQLSRVGRKREKQLCVYLEQNHSSHRKEPSQRLCDKTSWVSKKSKEARVAAEREGGEPAVDGIREARGPKKVGHCQDLDCCSE